MKTAIFLLTASLLGGATASAQPLAMKVAGKINAGVCAIDPASVLSIDYGDLPLDPGSGTAEYFHFDYRALKLLVSCGEPTAVAVKISDNHAAAKPGHPLLFFTFAEGSVGVPSDNFYGLQDTASGNGIGAATIRFRSPSVDHAPALFVVNSADGKSWSAPAIDRLFVSADRPYIRPRNSSTNTLEGRLFDFPMDFSALVIRNLIPANQDVSIGAGATFELIYL